MALFSPLIMAGGGSAYGVSLKACFKKCNSRSLKRMREWNVGELVHCQSEGLIESCDKQSKIS